MTHAIRRHWTAIVAACVACCVAGCSDRTTAMRDAAAEPAGAIGPAKPRELTVAEKERIERDKAVAALASFGAPQEVTVEFAFHADAGGKLLRDLLASPRGQVTTALLAAPASPSPHALPAPPVLPAATHLPGALFAPAPPPAPAVPSAPAAERVQFERLAPRAFVDALPAPRVLPVEQRPTDRRLPQRELPPLAASDMARPPLPQMPAGALVFAPSRLPPVGALPSAGAVADGPPKPADNPSLRPVRALTLPAVALGRDGPAPFAAAAAGPDPLAAAIPFRPLAMPATSPAASPRLPAPPLPRQAPPPK